MLQAVRQKEGLWPKYGGEAKKMLLEMEGRGVKQDLIPNVGQLEFANFHVKGLIIDPDVHGLLDGPGGVVCLPASYGEIVHTDVMPEVLPW